MNAQEHAINVANAIADRFDNPANAQARIRPHFGPAHWPQSLSHGGAGIALLHVERARAGIGSWTLAHRWIQHITTGITSGYGAFGGAPAVAHVLNTAAHAAPGTYQSALTTLDVQISKDLAARTQALQSRMDRREPIELADWDLISGLTGMTRYLLHRDPHGAAVAQALTCLIRLTAPVSNADLALPGWWSPRDPGAPAVARHQSGHLNLGLAHGVAGLLAILSIATMHHVEIPGQRETIAAICAIYDRFQQRSPAGPWWPQWVTIDELRNDHLKPTAGRASWCYGSPGIARAIHLAGYATGQHHLIELANHAIHAALAPDSPAAPLTDPSLCHGHAGLLHTARHLGIETSQLTTSLERLLASIGRRPGHAFSSDTEATADGLLQSGGPELLEGSVGIALVLHSYITDPDLSSPWDTCLLLQ